MDWDSEREQIIRKVIGCGVGVKVVIFNKKLSKEISPEFKEFVEVNDNG